MKAFAIRDNLRAVWDSATPDQRRRGRAWYREGNAVCAEIAGQSGYCVEQVAAVVSALSPRQRWEYNLILARRVVLGGERNGTFGSSIRQAARILNGEAIAEVLRGPKTAAFAANLAGDKRAVTVDVWIQRAAGVDEALRLTPSRHADIVNAIRDLARDLRMQPCDLQAVLWVTIKEQPRARKRRRTHVPKHSSN